MKTLTVPTFVLAGLLMTQGVDAQTAASWSFNGNVTPNTTGANVTASNTTLGSDIVTGAFNGVEYYGEGGWPTGAIDLNAYLQVTVAPSAGFYLVLNSIIMDLRRSTTGTAAGSGPTGWSLRSSVDGYTTDLISGTLTTSYQTITLNLPAAFQSLTSAVTFRIYGYNELTTSGGLNRLVTNGITIKGQSSAGTLAAQSIDLTANAVSQAVDLQWTAQGFAAGTDFYLLRSSDGSNFIRQDELMGSTAFGGSTTDNDVQAGNWFYRISAQSPDGSTYLSPIVAVKLAGVSSTGETIRGVVPTGTSVTAMLHLQRAGNYQLSIRGMDGKALYQEEMNGQAGDATTDIAFGTRPHGVYILTLIGNGAMISKEFIY